MVKDFEAKIAEHRRQIAELEAEQAAFQAMTPNQQLAITLHDVLCNWNHTDGCGWFYEVHKGVDDWHGHAHASWLQRATKIRGLLPDFTEQEIMKVVRAVKGLG